jgi:hypothetical protein
MKTKTKKGGLYKVAVEKAEKGVKTRLKLKRKLDC